MEAENNYKYLLLKRNTRYVLIEKFIIPKYIKDLFNKREYYLQNNSLLETYKVILRLLNGDDITLTKGCDAEINKWRKNPQKINIHLASFIIEELKIASLDSGCVETGERHYNVFMAYND